MRYLSVCSGIEAASVAWHPLGFTPVGFAEIERFPAEVLAHHYGSNLPGEAWSYNAPPNYGDMSKFKEWPDADVDVLVGGTPCQSFSIAGLRQGLADPRGNLALTYLAIADRYQPEWIAWENVPGVLSSNGGRDFAAFLGGLGKLGYGFAYRVLDAQYVRVDGFGRAVPQRRRRVFVVGNLGSWRRAAAVLFETESLSWNSAPRREAGKGFASDVAPSLVSRGRGVERCGETRGQDPVVAVYQEVAHCLNAGGMGRIDYETESFVAHSLRAEGFDASEDGTGRGTPIVPIAFSCKDHGADAVNDLAPTLRSMGHSESHANAGGQLAVAFDMRGREGGAMPEGPHQTANIRAASGGSSRSYVAHAIQAGALRENPESGPDGVGVQEGVAYTLEARAEVQAVQQQWALRRLTPLECERLQGFPDGYTNISRNGKPAADGPRYKALGNSMAVNVMRWIGKRIAMVDEMTRPK